MAFVGIAIIPHATNEAYGLQRSTWSYVVQCSHFHVFTTTLYQEKKGDDVTLTVAVPDNVCGYSFSGILVDLTDNNGKECDIYAESFTGTLTKKCPDFDLDATPISILLVGNYEAEHLVTYNQYLLEIDENLIPDSFEKVD